MCKSRQLRLALSVTARGSRGGLVAEVGPVPDRIAQMAARGKAHPNNMALLDIREENDLAAHCAASSRDAHFQMWGLDQEFVGSAGTLLDAMMSTEPGPKSRAAIAAAQVQERKADLEARRTGDPGKLFLLSTVELDVADVGRLRGEQHGRREEKTRRFHKNILTQGLRAAGTAAVSGSASCHRSAPDR
jgi:hypothetical protein